MIQTLIVAPSAVLKDHIRAFEIRRFNTFGVEIAKPVHAFHESLISIFINGKPASFTASENENPSFTIKQTSQTFCGVMGIQTSMKGTLIFSGNVKVLNIQFTPTGFSNIFKIPASHICNKMYNVEQVFTNQLSELQEQLFECKSNLAMISVTERFLVKHLFSKGISTQINVLTKASGFMLQHPGTFTVKELAYHSNMSLRTFERQFAEYIGVTPKLFDRIRRFNYAMEMKMTQPNLNWTNISYSSGYYDQMHLIKDFVHFTGLSPSAFFKNMAPPSEDVLSN